MRVDDDYDDASFVFSCQHENDLVSLARKHVAFLEGLHHRGVTLAPVSRDSIHRYVDCWLPLVATTTTTTTAATPRLVPPPDVAWLWHCHRLSPARYQAFTVRRFGRVLEADPPFCFQDDNTNRQAGAAAAAAGASQPSQERVDVETANNNHKKDKQQTQAMWKEKYDGEPFFLPHITFQKGEPSSPSLSCQYPLEYLLDGFDLIASTQCQANFLWQVSGPRFDDEQFLRDAVQKYSRFLKLDNGWNQQKNHNHQTQDRQPPLPLVPTYQIDLMWHTHMLQSCAGYRRDCYALRGAFLHHDDSLNDRTPGNTLDRAFAATVKLWEETYPGESYIVEGGMYRGEPPLVYFDHKVWTPAVHGDATEYAVVNGRQWGGASSTGQNMTVTNTSPLPTWEYKGDLEWTPYDPRSQELIEDAYQTMFVTFQSGNWTYTVDVLQMTQTNVQHDAHKTRPVQRQNNATWEFKGDGGWQPYDDMAVQNQLETAYQRVTNGSIKAVIQSGTWTYEIDVANLTQTNIGHPGKRRRKVRRTLVPVVAATTLAASAIPTAPPVAAAAAATTTTTTTTSQSRSWLAVHDFGCFLPAQPKSHTRNVNNNLKRDGYVFGRAGTTVGYFSLETREAWEIMSVRLRKRANHARMQYENYECSHCLCCGCKLSPNQIREKEQLENQWHELESMAAFARAKKESGGPDAFPSQAAIDQYRRASRRQRSQYDDYGYMTSSYTPIYVGGFAGCGGGDGGCGAGCGGGACGGGACGGGGCGGGGGG